MNRLLLYKFGLCGLLALSLLAGLLGCNISDTGKENRSRDLKNPGESAQVLERMVVDSVPGDFPVGFSFLTANDWQFIAYYNKDRNLTVASRKTDDSQWNYQTLPTRVGWDSHNRIEMVIDRRGSLHVSGNMHNDSMTYFITREPYAISTFERIFPLVSEEDELRCTYPSFMKGPQGEILFSYRKGGSGNGVTITNIYDEPKSAFRRLTEEPLFDGLGQMSAYARGPNLGPDGAYHLTWLWRDTPDCETNHDLSYARSKDLVHWETIDGRSLELPITPRNSGCTVDPVPPGGGALNGVFRLFFSQENTPLLAYMKYDREGNSQIFIAKAEGGTWTIKKVSDWDYRWAFSGPGSIDFEIRLPGTEMPDPETIKILYTHKVRGDGALWVDVNSLATLGDSTFAGGHWSPYPDSLLRPRLEEQGLMVHWLEAQSESVNRSDPFYVLRWETMGRRRYYEPPEQPVAPSPLILYRFSTEASRAVE